MSGGIREWCQDWYDNKYGSGQIKNPEGPQIGNFKIARGGSFWFDITGCTVSCRRETKPGYTYFRVGLRLAL